VEHERTQCGRRDEGSVQEGERLEREDRHQLDRDLRARELPHEERRRDPERDQREPVEDVQETPTRAAPRSEHAGARERGRADELSRDPQVVERRLEEPRTDELEEQEVRRHEREQERGREAHVEHHATL
jgi:hypothetical protein